MPVLFQSHCINENVQVFFFFFTIQTSITSVQVALSELLLTIMGGTATCLDSLGIFVKDLLYAGF